MTTDHDNLLAAVLANPGDDVPRLVYADWLEENAGEVECGAIGFHHGDRCDGGRLQSPNAQFTRECPACKGTGRVSNGFAERSEFIRCDIAAGGIASGDQDHAVEAFRQHREAWFPGVLAVRDEPHFNQGRFDGDKPVALISRGFVSRVSAPLAVLVGGECEPCGGSGQELNHVVIFGEGPDCNRCHSTGRTPGIAAQIARCQPVTEWVATDKEPQVLIDGKNCRWLTQADNPDIPGAMIRDDVFDRMSGIRIGEWGKDYPTRELALAALSRAIGEIAKQGEKV